jgi:hypothetical protein
MEYLDAGAMAPDDDPGKPSWFRRWLPALVGALAFVLMVGFFGAIAGDTIARNVEMNNLVSAIEDSEAAMGDVQENVTGIAAAYSDRLPLSNEDQDSLSVALMAAAAQGREQIAAAREEVAGVRWALWHQDVRQAQDAYLAHNQAWLDYLARASEDATEFGRPQDEVNTSFAQAEKDVRRAVPFIPLFDLVNRVDQIFAEPQPDLSDNGSGQSA